MPKLIIIDLDGTLIDNPSTEQSFLRHLLFRGYFGFKQIWNTLVFIWREWRRFGIFVFIKDKAYLTGLKVDQISAVSNELVNNKLLKRIRPWMRKRIQEHAQNGDIQVLLTGSHDFMAEIFAQNLGIQEVVSTKCVSKDGVFQNAVLIQHPFREDKLILSQELAKKYNISLADTVAYGNSFNDRFLLQAVGKPVAVTPDSKLRKLAEKQGWEILG